MHSRLGRTLTAAVIVIAMVAGLVLAVLGAADARPDTRLDRADRLERRAASVQVVGNGYGHGHGLSQWGAYYRAADGLSHQQILSFYYPRLKRGTVGGNVSVLITGDTSTDVMVKDRDKLTVKSLGNGKVYRLTRRADWWRILPDQGGKRSVVQWRLGSGGWRVLRTVAGEAQFDAGGAPITLHTPTENRAYRGVLRSAAPSATSGRRDTVNVLPLESYLRGVVPREVPASWPAQAVQAQAVAARTYAAFERQSPLARHYQICDTSLCQVYGGFTSEYPDSDRAIAATRKQVLLADGEPAFTQFSASNGGFAADGGFDYLPAQKGAYDKAYRGWKATVSGASIEAALPAIGAFRSVKVLERDGNGAYGGRVVDIRIVGSKDATVISGDTFRSFFGLRSTLFDVS